MCAVHGDWLVSLVVGWFRVMLIVVDCGLGGAPCEPLLWGRSLSELHLVELKIKVVVGRCRAVDG